MNNKYVLIYFLIISISCSKKNAGNSNSKILESNSGWIEGKDLQPSEMPKVDLVIAIEPIISQAISEHWDRNTWISRFGPPASERTVAGGVLMEYIQPGPYKASGKKLITGVIVALRNDETVDAELHYTTFGMPSY